MHCILFILWEKEQGMINRVHGVTVGQFTAHCTMHNISAVRWDGGGCNGMSGFYAFYTAQ